MHIQNILSLFSFPGTPYRRVPSQKRPAHSHPHSHSHSHPHSHTPKPLPTDAYCKFPSVSTQFTNSPYFRKIYKSPYVLSIYVLLTELTFFCFPYFDHDAFTHHRNRNRNRQFI